MKRNLFLILVAFAALSLIGCGTEDSKTELQLTNSKDSEVTINAFLWKDQNNSTNQSWESVTGWVPYVDTTSNSTTEAKEVTKTLGQVTASYNDPVIGPLDADVTVEGQADQEYFQLAEGGLNKYNVIAVGTAGSPKRKSQKK